ncbi:hypothetical protein FJZ18_04140 [Candidatus Pacearchaeota archaeon]|nr:hypothetical protein [Candidatus Pacearchaeota archaeon]
MEKKFLFITLLAFLFIPKLVSADIIIPLSFMTVPLIPFIILIEAFVFWLLVNKWIKVQTGFWKLILVVLVANLVTSLLGTFVPLYRYTAENLMWIGVAFVFSIFIEWGLYIPFFRKANIKIFDLLKISFIVNLATYISLAILIGLT